MRKRILWSCVAGGLIMAFAATVMVVIVVDRDPVPRAAAEEGRGGGQPESAPEAVTIVQDLRDKGAPITEWNVSTEDNDPNHLLGRPNGYLSRVAFDLPGGSEFTDKDGVDWGGVVEVWATEKDAKARSEYIQSLSGGDSIFGTEYHFLKGSVLLRIYGDVSPTLAKQVGAKL